MSSIPPFEEGEAEWASFAHIGATRRTILGGFCLAAGPLVKGHSAGKSGDTNINLGLLIHATNLSICKGVDLVTISGFKTIGDSGAGRQFVRDQLVTPAFVAANPTRAFLDAGGNGFALGGVSGKDGSSNLGFVHLGTAAVARSVQDKLRDTVSVRDFGAVGDGVADETAALFKARDHCAKTGACLVIPAGDYKYRVSPNWAITDLEVVAHGRVRLYYTGTEDALIFDGGPNAKDLCNNVRFGVGNRVHLYGKAATKNGVWARSIHHSQIGVNVHGCGSAHAGLHTQFAVCTVWDVVVSGNEGGWFEGNKPGFGYKLDKRLASETTSYCCFPNPVVEGVGVGIHLVATLGNLFVGGTSEGCSKYGVVASAEAMWDRFIGTDFEANAIADIYCNGLGAEFVSCDTYSQITLGSSARRCVISGGGHEHILLEPGSNGCSILNAVFNRRETGGTLIDSGVGTEILNVRNGAVPYTQYLTGSRALPSATVGPAESLIEVLSVLGAKPGDFFIGSCDVSIAGFQLSCDCIAPGIVNVTFANVAGASAHRAACTVKVRGMRGT